jgi:hypothetical protein
MREHMARTIPRNRSTIRNEVKDGAWRENGLNHRVSDDWGWGSCCSVEDKKRDGERLEPLRVITSIPPQADY